MRYAGPTPSLLLGATWSELVNAVPVRDGPFPASASSTASRCPPGTGRRRIRPPGYEDPLDKAVDSVGDEFRPLPYRNGLGASGILRPVELGAV